MDKIDILKIVDHTLLTQTAAWDEIRQIHEACGGKILKVIIETCLLTEEEKIKMCEIVTNAGAEYSSFHVNVICSKIESYQYN